MVVFLQCTLKEKLPFVLINTRLLHIPLLALTHGQNDGQRNRYTCCTWAGGFIFQMCHCVSFFVVAGNSFRHYLPTIPVVPLCLVAQVSFLVVAGKSFRCCLLTDHTSCAVVSFFWFWREIVFGCTVSNKESYSVSLRKRGSVYLSLYLLTVMIVSQKY
jgi:hypothetical protein